MTNTHRQKMLISEASNRLGVPRRVILYMVLERTLEGFREGTSIYVFSDSLESSFIRARAQKMLAGEI